MISASQAGEPLFYRPASSNYRPGVIGQDELKIRQDLLGNLDVPSPESFLLDPDRERAFAGARQRSAISGGGPQIPVTDEIRTMARELWKWDIPPGVKSIPYSTLNALGRESGLQNRPAAQAAVTKALFYISNATKDKLKEEIAVTRAAIDDMMNYRRPFDPAEKELLGLKLQALQEQYIGLDSGRPKPRAKQPGGDPLGIR